MSRPSVLILIVAAFGAAGVATAFAAASRARGQRQARTTTTTTVTRAARQAPALTPVAGAPRPEPSFSIAQVRAGHTGALRSKPNGRGVTRAPSTTAFARRTTLAGAAARGR